MTWTDTFRMAGHNLWCRRGRSALSLLGIVVGCCMLLLTDAGVRGVQRGFQQMFESSDLVRQIQISQDRTTGLEVPEDVLKVRGDMSESRRERIRTALRSQWLAEHQSQDWGIDMAQLEALEQLDHVQQVSPMNGVGASASILPAGQKRPDAFLTEISAVSRSAELMGDQLLAGSGLSSRDADGILIDDVLAWKRGFQDDGTLKDLVGREVKIIVRRQTNSLLNTSSLLPDGLPFGVSDFTRQIEATEAVLQLVREIDATTLTTEQKVLIKQMSKSLQVDEAAADRMHSAAIERTFRVRGVFAANGDAGLAGMFRVYGSRLGSGLLVSPATARELLTEAWDDPRTWGAMVTIDHYSHLSQVTSNLESHGMQCWSALKILERAITTVERSGLVVAGLAAIILLTTCIGICNTLFVSILERTPEFGTMKAVGADDRHVLQLMFCEGAVLGAAGGLLSIAISGLVAVAGDWILRAWVEYEIRESFAATLFRFSVWTSVAVVLLSITLCVVAGLIPAFRAARMDPVTAMRRR